MNIRGQRGLLGMALLMVAFVLIITVFVTIEPFKETLDNIRGTSSLNCRGTPDFNQTLFDIDNNNTLNKLTRRPTCFITGLTMVYFILAFLIAVLVWVVKNWRRIAK